MEAAIIVTMRMEMDRTWMRDHIVTEDSAGTMVETGTAHETEIMEARGDGGEDGVAGVAEGIGASRIGTRTS